MSRPVAPGDVLLGKYRVERVLGQGGMGVVVAVRHIELGELFAMKFLLPAALAHPDAVERFLREARASARLKGEHVVRVQDVGRLPDGMPYMVMEHLSGTDLRELVKTQGPLPITQALGYVLQACEALAEAHAEGIVHRDLKPANMFLIRRRNGTPCVKVLDFGISKQMEPETAEQHALTRTGMVLGSPLYMSPEQMMRTKEADPRGDLWSMGVVLYELLTGTVPFLADALTELVGKVLQETPVPPSRHRPEIPPEVDAVVMTCLQKRREQRYQTADQLMDALRGAMSRVPAAPKVTGDEPTQLLAPGPLPASRAQTTPLLAAPALAPTPIPIPMPAGPAAQTGQAWGNTAGPSHAAPAPKRTGVPVVGALVGLLVVGGGALAAWRLAGDSAATGTPEASASARASGDVTTAPAPLNTAPAPATAPDATVDPSATAAPGGAAGRPAAPHAATAAGSGPAAASSAAAASTSAPTSAAAATPPAAASTPSSAATTPAATPMCKSRFDCKPPLVCTGGVCSMPSCTGDAACGPGRYCTLEGRCETLAAPAPAPAPVNACKTHLDCKAPLVCPAGVCVAPQCTKDVDCGSGRYCSLEGQCKTK